MKNFDSRDILYIVNKFATNTRFLSLLSDPVVITALLIFLIKKIPNTRINSKCTNFVLIHLKFNLMMLPIYINKKFI